jgi:hypothetical protein
MRSAISSTSFSLWVMKMIDFPSALRLLMIPNSSRASCGVEDEDVGPAVERLEDLDALLLANGDVLHERRRIDGEAVLLGELAHAALSAVLVQEDAVPRLDAEDDVLRDGEDRNEHEVLVHHPDARLDRVARGTEDDRLPAQEDLAGVGLVEAVQDVHQRRLAGAVLAEERVHLALADVERDIVVGEDTRELLPDSPHFENELLGRHPVRS